MSKVLICLVDAGLNVWFLRIVRQRLVRYYGLKKYAPLVRFTAWLMLFSIGMDVSSGPLARYLCRNVLIRCSQIMLIGLMFLENGLVFVQFHPVTYMVKLNIEMSMASLITRLARGSSHIDVSDLVDDQQHSSQQQQRSTPRTELDNRTKNDASDEEPIELQGKRPDSERSMGAPLVTTDIRITTHDIEAASQNGKIQPREAF